MKAHRPYRHQPATRVINYDNAIWHSMPRYPGFRYQTYRRGYYTETLVLEGYRYGRCIYEGEASTLNWAGHEDDTAVYAEEALLAEFIERAVQPFRTPRLA